jgi:hypothetical protein
MEMIDRQYFGFVNRFFEKNETKIPKIKKVFGSEEFIFYSKWITMDSLDFEMPGRRALTGFKMPGRRRARSRNLLNGKRASHDPMRNAPGT